MSDPITRQRSKWTWRMADYMMTGTHLFSRNVHDGQLAVIVAIEPEIGWHLSISFRNQQRKLSRYPTWDEIVHAREAFLPDELAFVMHLPVASEYVALHDTTFHLHQHPEPGGTL